MCQLFLFPQYVSSQNNVKKKFAEFVTLKVHGSGNIFVPPSFKTKLDFNSKQKMNALECFLQRVVFNAGTKVTYPSYEKLRSNLVSMLTF